jgi:hypothetical protein
MWLISAALLAHPHLTDMWFVPVILEALGGAAAGAAEAGAAGAAGAAEAGAAGAAEAGAAGAAEAGAGASEAGGGMSKLKDMAKKMPGNDNGNEGRNSSFGAGVNAAPNQSSIFNSYRPNG